MTARGPSDVPAIPSEQMNILQGRLDDFPLPDILQVLQVSRKSGALFLRRDDGQQGIVAFREGNIVQTLCTECYQTLGDRLVERRIIRGTDLQVALDHLARFPGMRLGDALVHMGSLTRAQVEDEVKVQMTETIERLIGWIDAQFEFRVGLVSIGREVPEFAVDLILEKGVEPRYILLKASVEKDHRRRDGASRARPGCETPSRGGAGVGEDTAPARDVEDENGALQKVIARLEEGSRGSPATFADPDQLAAARSFLSLSEELYIAHGRGELVLLLLRSASELYEDGGLVLREGEGFRVLGQFGENFWWKAGVSGESKNAFAAGECPLFDTIAVDKRPYTGLASLTEGGGLAPAPHGCPAVVSLLAIPLTVLGSVSLILFCRIPAVGAPDARPLIALTRQAAITLENATLRKIARQFAEAARRPAGQASRG